MRTFTPQDYVATFKQMNITLVIRLNHPQYESQIFEREGIRHLDLYFLDGSTPPSDIVVKFLKVVEENKGAVAVHCKAGLGRTGSLIAMYAMKHYRFVAADFIAWIRILRPGSILGPQQRYLVDMQSEVYKLNESSEIWRSLPNEYKEFTYMMEKTDEKAVGQMSIEEQIIAQNGDFQQGEKLMERRIR